MTILPTAIAEAIRRLCPKADSGPSVITVVPPAGQSFADWMANHEGEFADALARAKRRRKESP